MLKIHSQSLGVGIRGFIPGNGREREFLIPGFPALLKFRYSELFTVLSVNFCTTHVIHIWKAICKQVNMDHLWCIHWSIRIMVYTSGQNISNIQGSVINWSTALMSNFIMRFVFLVLYYTLQLAVIFDIKLDYMTQPLRLMRSHNISWYFFVDDVFLQNS